MKARINPRTSFHLSTLESELEHFLKELTRSQSETPPDQAARPAKPAAPLATTTSEPTT